MAFAALTAAIFASAIPLLRDAGPTVGGYLAVDYKLYMGATSRWLAGGGYFEAHQLVGTYAISPGDILYPPVALWLFVPFTMLPALLWWAIPVTATAWAMVRLRPAVIVWPLLALCLVFPPTIIKIAAGNPVIWVEAALAVGVVTVGPAVFVLVKPSLAPFALWGARHRRWWAYLVLVACVSLPFAGQWADSVDSSHKLSGWWFALLRSVGPIVVILLIAWWSTKAFRGDAGNS